ncbi:MAG: PepSY domain-containing protein [Proteobacteria bacterium]|jgi:uncharacterized membrane protein YkoI|nr:PepSY domain-containing protein [Pseudomonadota bacterium]
MRWFILMMLLAASPFSSGASMLEKVLGNNSDESASQKFLPKQRSSVSRKEVAELVKRRYGNSRILSIVLVEGKGPATYRVKMLSDSGVVKHVYVDAVDGDVFE